MKKQLKNLSRRKETNRLKNKSRSADPIWDLPKIMAKIPYPKKPLGLSEEDKIIYDVED